MEEAGGEGIQELFEEAEYNLKQSVLKRLANAREGGTEDKDQNEEEEEKIEETDDLGESSLCRNYYVKFSTTVKTEMVSVLLMWLSRPSRVIKFFYWYLFISFWIPAHSVAGHIKPKINFQSYRKYDPDCSSRIRIYPSWIQGSKRHRVSDPQHCPPIGIFFPSAFDIINLH